MRRTAFAAVLAFGLLAGACSGGSDTGDTIAAALTTSPAVTATAAAPVAEPTPTESVADVSPVPEDPVFTETSDLVYRTVDGVELLIDVFTPVGDGPWPVVVSFHGLASNGKDFTDTTVVAEEAAANDMVVFTPTWIAGNPFPITIDTIETWDDTVSCAVAFAQQHAAEYGGDATRTVVDGFSAGAGATLLFASLEPRTDPVVGCETDAVPTPVVGFVFGEVESWLYSENFDGAFDADLEATQARLASLIGPASWSANPGAEYFIWVAADGTSPRAVGDSADESGWFEARDPDGSIQADLESLDQFADGVVTAIDAGQLLEFRLAAAGLAVTLDEYPGGHTTRDKVSAIVGYLRAAADR